MSARSFRSVFMVASCAGAALGCYLVSLRVASERAALEDVETKIVLAQRDIRLLQTEIGTRGRLAQLERWNVKVIALSAPTADQFLKGGFELARLTAPEREAPIDAPVILASAPAPANANRSVGSTKAAPGPAKMMHMASLKTAPAPKNEVSIEPRSAPAAPRPAAVVPKPATAANGKTRPQQVSIQASGAKVVVSPKPGKAASPPGTGVKGSKTTKEAASKAPSDRPAPLPETRTKLAESKAKTSKDSAKTR